MQPESAQPRIQIATVEIRALKIGSKQMTQAVFKQLEESPLIDAATGLLCGNPWGWVNYNQETKRQRNFVWERDGKLYRCLVHLDGPLLPGISEWKQGDPSQHLNWLVSQGQKCAIRFANWLLLADEITTEAEWFERASFYVGLHTFSPPVVRGEYHCDLGWGFSDPPDKFDEKFPMRAALFHLHEQRSQAPSKLQKINREPTDRYNTTEMRERRLVEFDENQKRLDRWFKALKAAYFRPDQESKLEHNLKQAETDTAAFMAVWDKSLTTLDTFDQLFIAV